MLMKKLLIKSLQYIPWIFLSLLSAPFVYGAALTMISGSTVISTYPTIINTNLSNINAQLTYDTNAMVYSLNSATAFRIYNSNGSSTVLTVDSASGSTTVAGFLYASNFYATSTTATSSFMGGVIAGQALRLSGSNFASCNLDTDANGYLQCGTDTGSFSGTQNRLTYFDSGTSIASANSFIIDSGNGSTTFPILNVGTLTATSGTSWINALSLGTALSVANGGTGQTSFTAGNLLYGSNGNAISNVATGTLTAGTGLTGNAVRSVVGGALTIDCDTADTNTTGCLTDTDWDTFNNKQATISVTAPITLTGATVAFNTAFQWNSALGSTTWPVINVGVITATTSATSTFGGPIKVGTGFFKDALLTASIPFATSSLAYYGSATATFQKIFSYPVSIQRLYCVTTNGGTFNSRIGTGSATSTMISVSGTRGDTSASVAVTEAQTIYLEVGTMATSPTGVCSFDYYRTN